jgi:hypothetical protein
VSIQYDAIKTQVLQERITAAPDPHLQGVSQQPSDTSPGVEKVDTTDFYPSQWMTYSTGGGLNQESQHVTFFTLRVYPVRYNQRTDMVLYLDSCDITISYETPAVSPFPSQAKNDLLIICPTQFSTRYPITQHKNTVGVRTQIITLAEIYRTYPGYDRPEQIKFCIKDFVETWGTTYVLLVGGLKSHLTGRPRDDINTGTRDWYVPVRYANLWDDAVVYDPGFISDLYYADIYDSQGSFVMGFVWNGGMADGLIQRLVLDYPQDRLIYQTSISATPVGISLKYGHRAENYLL